MSARFLQIFGTRDENLTHYYRNKVIVQPFLIKNKNFDNAPTNLTFKERIEIWIKHKVKEKRMSR